MKENCYNSRTSDHIDMKLGPVTNLHKRKKATSKKFDDEVLSKSRDAIFPIFVQFGAIWMLDFLLSVKSIFKKKVYFVRLQMCIYLRA